MPLDPNIALSVKPIEVASPLQTIGGLMQMRGQLSRVALQQAQVQDINAQAQQRQRDLVDQQTFQRTLAENGGDWNKAFAASAGKIAPINLLNFQNKHAETVKAQSMNDEQEIKNHTERLKSIGSSIAGIMQLPDEATRQTEYANYRTRALADPQLAKEIGSLPDSWSDDFGKQAQWAGTASQQINEAALKLQAENRAATASTDTHNKTVAEIPGITAESSKKELVTKAMQEAMADPTKGGAAIDAALPPSTDAAANQGYKAAWQSAMAAGSPEAAARIVEAAAQHATSLSPATAARKVQTATEELKATEPIRTAAEIAKERVLIPMRTAAELNKEVQRAKLAPNGFGNIIEPAARARVEAQYDAQNKEALTKLQEGNRLQAMIAAAQGGNKAAPGVIPLQELKMFVPRINRTELESVSSGAGNLVDKLQGFIGKAVEGEPIPPDILRDTLKLSDINKQATLRNYKLGVATLNAAHQTSVPPVDFEKVLGSVAPPSGGSGHAVGDTVSVSGKKVKITAIHPDGSFDGNEVK